MRLHRCYQANRWWIATDDRKEGTVQLDHATIFPLFRGCNEGGEGIVNEENGGGRPGWMNYEEKERERGRERRGRRSRWRRLYARTWAEWAIKTDVERAGECKWSRLLADLFRICLHGTPATLFYIQRGRGQSIPGLGCFAIPGDDAGI